MRSWQWSTGQDANATIKRQLQRLLPGVRVFLDVDDLDDIADLEAHIQASAAALVYLGSVSYFGSPNCMREVCASKEANLPLVRVHESDMSKASASLYTPYTPFPEPTREEAF